jgi:hypothetical protein
MSANSARYNRAMAGNEQTLSVNQANAQENQVRRMGREALGRQSAAFAASGVGYQGSSGAALKQSAINEELDALNTRYKGAVTGYGYGAERELYGRQAGMYNLTAAAQLLKGAGSNYSFAPQTAQSQDAGF